MRRIGRRLDQSLLFQAGIHGLDLTKDVPSQAAPVELTPEQEALTAVATARAMERKRKEFQKNG